MRTRYRASRGARLRRRGNVDQALVGTRSFRAVRANLAATIETQIAKATALSPMAGSPNVLMSIAETKSAPRAEAAMIAGARGSAITCAAPRAHATSIASAPAANRGASGSAPESSSIVSQEAYGAECRVTAFISVNAAVAAPTPNESSAVASNASAQLP